jgi:hypothetical protein
MSVMIRARLMKREKNVNMTFEARTEQWASQQKLDVVKR